MRHLDLYGRDGCHLCDEALAAIELLRSEVSFELTVIDIERDEALLARYLERIPVVEVDGKLVSELILDLSAVRAALGLVRA